MSEIAKGTVKDGEVLRDIIFKKCKYWLIWGYVCKAVVYLVGVVIVVFSTSNPWAPVCVALLAALSELIIWRSDFLKGEAESVHWKLDYEDSLGWRISADELRDLWVRFKQGTPLPRDSNYFASNEKPGVNRALQNLKESCWWSKHLSRLMAFYLLSFIFLLVSACFACLLFSVYSIPSSQVAGGIIRIVTSSLLIIFSFGLVRLWFGHFTFKIKCERTEIGVRAMLGSGGSVDLQEVIKLWNDYHLSRASAPVLPTWLWKLHQKYLNELWKTEFPER